MSYSEFDYAKKDIDGVVYKIKLLNTSEAFLSGQELLKLTLPSMGAFADGVKTMDDPFSDQTTFTAISYSLVKQLGDVNTLSIIKLLLHDATANDDVINFESYFRGKLGLLVNVVEFAMMENYGSLFTDMGLKQRLMSFMKGLAPQTPEQPQLEE